MLPGYKVPAGIGMTIGYGSLCLCGFIGCFFPSPATSTVAVVLLVIAFPATIWGVGGGRRVSVIRAQWVCSVFFSRSAPPSFSSCPTSIPTDTPTTIECSVIVMGGVSV